MLLRSRFEPDGVAMRQKIIVSFLFRDDAAADRDDGTIGRAKNAFESALLNGAITGLAVERKKVGERHSSFFFDFLVEFDKGEFAFRGELGTERGFTAAAEANQRDASESHILLQAEVAHQTHG